MNIRSYRNRKRITKKYLFEELYNMWIIQYKKSVRASTYTITKGLFQNHILPVLGKIPIDKLNLLTAQNAVNEWSQKLKKYKSLKTYAQQIYKYAMRLELIEKDPFKFVIMPGEQHRTIKRIKNSDNYYTKEELLSFLEIAKKELSLQWYCFFRLIAYTGIRRGEALALTWEDVDFTHNEITINKTLSWDEQYHKKINPSKTKAGERIIKIDGETMDVLSRWRSLNIDEPLIFCNKNHEHISLSTPQKHLNKLFQKHELKRITIHGLRHTHCSLLFEAGVPIKEVQDRLGHDDIKTTLDIYTHISKKQKDRALDTFVNFMNQE